jgi:xanthine dehydrogenase accessory factor
MHALANADGGSNDNSAPRCAKDEGEPLRDLFDEILRRADVGEPVAVCTLVRTRGSTPQKRGAVMVVLRDGTALGTIGGGCVEADVKARALRLLGERADRLISFKLDHDPGWDDGLICGGAIDVAVQVVDSRERAAPFRAAREVLAGGQVATLAIDVPDESGQRQHFEQPVEPAPLLLIAGAGHVGAALAQIGAQIDFRVGVIDDRADLATPQRLGAAAKCIIGPIDQELARYPIDQRSYVVVVTRGHRHDASALAAVIRSPAKYVGLIGSKRKVIQLFGDLRQQGVEPEMLQRVHAPIGLDIGAITPAEIAVSVAAELIAVRREAEGPAEPMRLTDKELQRIP